LDLHVTDLFPDLGQLLKGQVLAMLLGELLEVLDDLRYLHAEGHGEVLWGVELFPVSLPNEAIDGTPQLIQTEILPDPL
jgi:hypothetical protein